VGFVHKCAGEGAREHVGTPSLNPPAAQPKVIAAIRGSVIARGADHVVVETNGVGYKVFVPRHPSRDEVLLHTHQVVREDDESLYGFETREELTLFEMLISVSGVGPKAGLAILSVARPAEIAGAIASGDTAVLARAPGVGKKTAERLIVDLKGKIGRVAGLPLTSGAPVAGDDAHAALVALGYTASEAATALRDAPPRGSATTEERLAAALRVTGRTAVAGG
jgi:Holliday junction DNA helicase RuvA